MDDQEIDLSSGVPMATAMPVLATPLPTAVNFGGINRAQSELSPQQVSLLQQQGYPLGLAQELGRTTVAYPIRFWVVDNSGSMRTNDGSQVRSTSRDAVQVVECTRWAELQGTIEYHAQLAGVLQVSTVFRMLNDPGVLAGPQEFAIAQPNGGSAGPTDDQIAQEVALALSVIRKSEPRGVTPLTEHVEEIRSRIQAIQHVLESQGQQAVIVLATDGLPSNSFGESNPTVQQAFVSALRSLQSLPVWIVVRLCTNDDSVVEFYNNLDQILELPLEVIDDFFGEGKEIHAANPWLNYTLPLHRCREMGYHHRVFDLLDERLLNKDELMEFFNRLFGSDVMAGAPDIHGDWQRFCSFLADVVRKNGVFFNPGTRRMEGWIDMKQLDKCFHRTRTAQGARAHGQQRRGLFASLFGRRGN